MDDETKAKLEAALTRRATATTEADLQKAQAAKEAAEREERKQAARRQWNTSLQDVEAAIREINARVSPHGLQFTMSDIKKPDTPGLAQVQIFLIDAKQPNSKDKSLVLNVSAYGLIQPVGLGPHRLGQTPNFSVHEASQARYEQLLTDLIAKIFK